MNVSPRRNDPRRKTHMTINPTAGKSRISSSYRSFSSSLKGASKARTLLNSLALLDAESTNVGCISDRVRAAPMGNAEEGAIDSERASSVTRPEGQDK